MTSAAGIIETIVASTLGQELGKHSRHFLMASDPTTSSILLKAVTPKYLQVEPEDRPIWRAEDGYQAYILSQMRLIALRHKLDRVMPWAR